MSDQDLISHFLNSVVGHEYFDIFLLSLFIIKNQILISLNCIVLGHLILKIWTANLYLLCIIPWSLVLADDSLLKT